MERQPRVGVGVFVRHQGKILLGRRRGSHGEGTWALPGGHLEFKEALDACARREVAEETNLAVTNVHVGTLTNDVFEHEDRHYVTIFMVCDYAGGDLRIACPWANNTCAVHADGSVVACAVDYEGRFSVGNVRDSSLRELWAALGERLRRVHREHRWGELPALCQGCGDWQVAGARYEEQERAEQTRPFWYYEREGRRQSA